MAEIAIAGAIEVLRQVVIKLGKLVVHKGGSLYKLTEDLKWIENEMRYMRAYLGDADADDVQGGSSVEGGRSAEVTSPKNIRALAYDVEDVVETYFPHIASQKGKAVLGRLKIAKTARDFAGKIESIRGRVEKINSLITITRRIKLTKEKIIGSLDPRRSFPHIDEVNVEVGLDEHFKKLVDKVLARDPKHRVVSIIGMAGVGKTTLAKKIYNFVAQRFECSAWICASQLPNIEELLLDTARQVGLEKEKWEGNIKDNLFAFLHHKRYVIVIDDLWTIEPWDVLKNGIPHQSDSGSRIILTSRNRDVGVHVGGESSIYELQPLNQTNARELFSEKMKERSDYFHPQLENISNQIVERCRGVPLAIVLTARMLFQRERTEHAWKEVLEILGGQEEDRLSNILALSYKDLPSKLKPCFLYFGLFPEDYEIPAFDLINLWAAEGFIRQGGGVQEVEDVGEDYLNQLISKNLIQVSRRRFDGRIRSFRIHDIIHHLCARVAKEIDFFNAHNDVDGDSAKRVRRVTTYNRSLREYISSNYRTPKLHAVLCFNKEDESELTKEQVKSFLKELRLLRVLSLEFQLLQISLPSEIGNLSHLSYLQLKVAHGRTRLPSAIGNLRSLLTLDVRECPDGVIIPDCIWKMKELRHFLLSEKCEIEVIVSFSVEVLLYNVDKLLNPTKEAASSVNLKTLYGLNLKVSYCLLKYWFPKFTKLTKLGLSFKDGDLSKVKVLLDAATLVSHQLEILRLDGLSREKRYNILDLNLSRYVNLSRLHLGGPIVELPECDKLPPNLTKLTLVNTNLLRDPMETLKELSKLKILKLGEESYLQEKMSAQGNNIFPQLEVLVIDKLNQLEEIQVMEGAIPQLTKIIIKGCGPRVRIPNRNPHIVTPDEKVESFSLR